MSTSSSWFRPLHTWLAAAAFALATFLIWRALRQYSLSEIRDSLSLISSRHLGLGAAFTVASFLCITAADTLAVRYTRSDLPYRKIALTSFTALSIGHTLGFAAFSSGAVRYRFYTGWGLSPGDVGRIIVFCSLTVLVGICTAGGIAALNRPGLVAELFGVAPGAMIALGLVLLLVVAIYLGLAAVVRWPIRIHHFELPVPPLKLALGQVVVGTSDLLLVSAVLHQMLSASVEIDFFPVAMSYVAANSAAIFTHVPGGLGVIEVVVLSLVPGANVVGALIAFRVVYYLIPFVIGSVLFAACEILRQRRATA
jgi:glycosyltransferase 2 family protein